MSPTIETQAPDLETDAASCGDIADRLPSVADMRARHPLTPDGAGTVAGARREFGAILEGVDPRMAVIAGPCSIHDTGAAMEYGERVRQWRQRFGDKLLVLMRVYLEKPRTTIGWKGFLNDPGLDGTNDVKRGLSLGRDLLCSLADSGVPAATELVDPIIAPYLEDTIAWACIGARTVESQSHRQMVSGLAAPAGFKNGTQGDVRVAVDAIQAAAHSHVYPALDGDGSVRLLRTKGNRKTHIVLRGGRNGTGCNPNWDGESLARVCALLEERGAPRRVMVDCSHANSGYEPARQIEVARSVMEQCGETSGALLGVMLESNLDPGSQKVNGDKSRLRRGVSITDPCIGADETETLLEELASRL